MVRFVAVGAWLNFQLSTTTVREPERAIWPCAGCWYHGTLLGDPSIVAPNGTKKFIEKVINDAKRNHVAVATRAKAEARKATQSNGRPAQRTGVAQGATQGLQANRLAGAEGQNQRDVSTPWFSKASTHLCEKVIIASQRSDLTAF